MPVAEGVSGAVVLKEGSTGTDAEGESCRPKSSPGMLMRADPVESKSTPLVMVGGEKHEKARLTFVSERA